MPRYVKGSYLFDGFAHRPFNEETDGWLNEMPSGIEFPAIDIVNNITDMFEEIVRLRKANWELRKEVARLRSILLPYKSVGSQDDNKEEEEKK